MKTRTASTARCLAGIFLAVPLLTGALNAAAMERLHLLIPGGAGGGWDATARGVGEALSRSGLVETVSFENMSGGSGSRALSHLIETASRQTNTLMISSTPIIIRSLQDIFPQSYRDVTPVASVIVDYGAFVVRMDSDYQNWRDVVAHMRSDPRQVNVAGGSGRGSMDHLVAAYAFKQSGLDPKSVKYIPYNAGGHAMVGLLSGETQLLATGLGEAVNLSAQGEVRILAITAQERLPGLPQLPTLVEQGVPAVFLNWRGFFAAPGTSEAVRRDFESVLREMYDTESWQQIRNSHGWTDYFVSGAEFSDFLARQREEVGSLMEELGMLQ